VSLLLDALKRAETQKRRNNPTDNLSSAIPDIDFSAIDPVALQRSGAKNLFSAKQISYDGFGKAKQIAALGGTALLLGAAGFYAWYWYNLSFHSGSQISLNSPSLPSADLRAPAITPDPPQNEPPPAPVTQSPALDLQPALTPVTPPPASKSTRQQAAAISPAKTNPQNTTKAVAKTKPRIVNTASTTTAASVTGITNSVASVPVTTSSAPTVSTVGSSNFNDNNIQLRRSNEEAFAINPDLGAAYQALIAGRTAEAQQKYEMVLQKDPANIDAELGLATISAKNNNAADAARRYKRVLELSPKNAFAIAGNAALINDLPQTENQLRAQIALQPQSAPLVATLGNVFASQNRWNEAQQAYFDAVRLDANHPDYVFNLAVSLDQINQSKLALENYQKALALANVRPSQFSKDAVAKRIAELLKIR
jgi:cytochrome c-type biogenesis protein CcmH/NrfG